MYFKHTYVYATMELVWHDCTHCAQHLMGIKFDKLSKAAKLPNLIAHQTFQKTVVSFAN